MLVFVFFILYLYQSGLEHGIRISPILLYVKLFFPCRYCFYKCRNSQAKGFQRRNIRTFLLKTSCQQNSFYAGMSTESFLDCFWQVFAMSQLSDDQLILRNIIDQFSVRLQSHFFENARTVCTDRLCTQE